MSLRLRLTLLYTGLIGGVLLLFGSMAYGLVNVFLQDQIDNELAQQAELIIEQIRVDSANQVDTRSVRSIGYTENFLFQVWGLDGKLQLARPVDLEEPLDMQNQFCSQPVYTTVENGMGRVRVISVPIRTQRSSVGVLQVALEYEIVAKILNSLSMILVIVAVTTMAIAAVGVWLMTGQALRPLEKVTGLARKITNAEDLMRRISIDGFVDREVGDLIHSFNQILERLEKLLNAQIRFLADVSHDLRTPLTVIKGNIGLMRQLKVIDYESLNSIEREVDRLARLVGDLLLMAQAESGKFPLEEKVVELDTVLIEVYQQIRSLSGKQIKVKLEEIDQIQVMGDRDRLKQVLLNISGNSVQHIGSEGTISFRLFRKESRACIKIIDNGPGISKKDLPFIFERFYRGEKSRIRKRNTGFGLGLSIAKWIVNKHNGTINVESVEGEGTTFVIELPIIEN